ncbi:long-chain fatty acid--CoA ligase [Limibacter armeniacum]|uniref:long-chain-fatty-acid--CoA ligase n=1 Tax=Limibacter armeniacum TaxID=466084 RepID=UPI002FE5EFE0
MLNLSIILEESAQRVAQKDAIIFGDNRISFSALNTAANQIANGLRSLGINKGDKVAISCPNLPYFPMVYYGILKTGAIVVPLNVLLKKDEVAYHLDNSDAKAYFCFEGTAELPISKEGYAGFEKTPTCEHFIMMSAKAGSPSPIKGVSTLSELMKNQSPEFDTEMTNPDDTAVILYTSGTTGKPKGAELSHFNIFSNAQASRDLLTMQNDDISLITLPLFHSFGQVVQMNAAVLKGITSVLVPRFDPETVLNLLVRHRVSIFCGVPTMYWALLNHPEADDYKDKLKETLRICAAGGSSLPVQVLKDFENKFQTTILEGYGLSETSPVATFNFMDKIRKPGSVGLPLWGVSVKVVDENGKETNTGQKGEILIKGLNVMKGYYKRPEASAKALDNGWLHTGDIGKMDEDGYLYIVDRVKDMIIRGGYNVYPREVEETLMNHPAISMAAVIGIPHEKHGEEVKACIVLKEGTNASESEILEWVKAEMASHKYPRVIDIRKTLPMNATGKILKTKLREEVENTAHHS